MRIWMFLPFLVACPSNKDDTAGDTAPDTAIVDAFAPNTGTWHVNDVVVLEDTCGIDDGKIGKDPEGTLTITDNGDDSYGLSLAKHLPSFTCALVDTNLVCDEIQMSQDYSHQGVSAVMDATLTLGLAFSDEGTGETNWSADYTCAGDDCDTLATSMKLTFPCNYSATGQAEHVAD